MSRLLVNRDGGTSNEYGTFAALGRLFTGDVIEGFQVVPNGTPNMTVKVNPGSGRITTGTYPSSYGYFVSHDTTGGESVTIATAAASPRIDYIVAYVDKSVTPSASPGNVNNTNNIFKFASVAGTPSGSPVVPTVGQIQTAIGAANPYAILAQVAVAASVSTITSPNITDVRSMANSTAKVGAPNIDFTTGIWWEEIGRTTLTTAGDTLSVASLPTKKYIHFIFSLAATGGTINPRLILNNDATANYSERGSTNGGPDGVAGPTSNIGVTATASTADRNGHGNIVNVSTKEKLVEWLVNETNTTGAGFAAQRALGLGKWGNITNPVSRIDIINTGTGDFAIGSEVIVLGHN